MTFLPRSTSFTASNLTKNDTNAIDIKKKFVDEVEYLCIVLAVRHK